MESSAEFRFGPWTLRRQPRELFKDGRRIPLQDQPLQILDELLAHAGALVTREQLIARLWPKRIVDFDTALNAGVRRLRAALGDEADTPRYIETIPRKGYRFIGTLEPTAADEPAEAAPSASEPSRRRWLLSAAGTLLLILAIAAGSWYLRDRVRAPASSADPLAREAATRSVAVLPFTDLSVDEDQQYFSDGLTEEILNLLAQSRDLRVIARTSSFSFKGENVDIPTVARKLNVTHVLEGSVRKAGGRVRITAQLVDGATSTHVWSQSYDRELTDVFAVQSDIAASVASALRAALDVEGTPGQTADAQAYERLLRARFFFQRRAPGDLERARQYYEQALEIQADLARAWSGLASVYWIQVAEGHIPLEAGLAKLRSAAERALALDPGLAEAHVRLMNYHWAIGDQRAADDHARRAGALEPDHPMVIGIAVGTAAKAGRLDEAIELNRRIVTSDPLSVISRSNLADLLFFAGRFDEARTESLKVAELDPSRLPDVAAFALILQRRFDEAHELIRSWPDGADRMQGLALLYRGLGQRQDADAALKRLIEATGSSDPFRIAHVYAYRGETDEAFSWLQRAVEQYGIGNKLRPSRRQLWVMRLSPFLKPLHADPRWKAWVASTSPE